MAEQQNGDGDNRQWFLRINGETVFGPVPTQGLIVWAEQGRILPGHEVSEDRKKWMQAVSLELLAMRWFVDDNSGELRGPLNRLAAETLIKSGKVAEGAQLVSADDVEDDGGAEKENGGAANAAASKTIEAQQRRIRELEKNVAELEPLKQQVKKLERQLKETSSSGDARVTELELQLKDAASGNERTSGLEQAVQFHERKAEETAQILSTREAELDTMRTEVKAAQAELENGKRRIEELEARLAAADAAKQDAEARSNAAESARQEIESQLRDTEAARQDAESRAEIVEMARQEAESRIRDADVAKCEAETRVNAAEAEMAALLNDANARDISYQEKIAELEKMSTQSPEEAARFIADQAAVYELIKAEVAELATALESERALSEQLKTWSVQRQQSLLERRQKLLKHLGGSPADMTRRAGRDQASVDLQAARLRAELESLRVTHQREMQLVETKEREWQERIRGLETEESRLRAQVGVGDKKALRVQELEELVGMREHELASERKNREEEREQFEANQRTLLMRIETLERAKPNTPEEAQSAEARNVKLASWMRLKK